VQRAGQASPHVSSRTSANAGPAARIPRSTTRSPTVTTTHQNARYSICAQVEVATTAAPRARHARAGCDRGKTRRSQNLDGESRAPRPGMRVATRRTPTLAARYSRST